MKRWIDVAPLDWFYRDVLDATRLFTDSTGKNPIINGMFYNGFESGFGRVVKRFITIEGQREFLIPEYNYHVDNPMYVNVNGIDIIPESIETGKVTLSTPLSAGIEVVCIAYGKVAYRQEGCVTTPFTSCSDVQAPYADLKNSATYKFSLSYPVETCSVLGVKLKRILVEMYSSDDADKKITEAIGWRRDVFVVHKGRVYLPAMYNGFPAKVGYNYMDKGVVKHTTETVLVEASCVKYNDRFFPNVRLRRAEFFVFMSRIRENFYNRFTDRQYIQNPAPQRYIADKREWSDEWYAPDVLSTLDEKFLDGCYVFPLYEDDKFEPEECVTRAEAVTYLNRFIEWSIERFR
ncbi:hypothetical protein SECTIM467_37 [Brevibacillus phage SecTim467]|uniref:SLH domain-containing protein n=2 Tax=Jenstvirus jenst TaxID=1982225 RepID=A0A0K2CP35_9CAUD|nr:hypothetical protein AVV11_gp154 [Brevibacillus phage Jenst]ALA07167.1 hypothetical protein JENST_37 [Brevibacillus phage Jenst]ALA07536.1 hypothetical protein SECTIM467_37 [Brevibacillus phage SecTim467]